MPTSRFVVWVCVSLLGMSTLPARDFYMTVPGAGSREGTNWENAMGGDRLSVVFNETMQPGDRLLLAGGNYGAVELLIYHGGAAGRSKELLGVDRGNGWPLFSDQWTVEQPAKGGTALRIGPGVSHVTIRGLRLRGYAFGVHAPADKADGSRSHLRFEDIGIEQCRHGFFLADCDDVAFRGCMVKRYTKHGFRFEQGCDRVRLEQCVADCSEGDPEWETRTELFPFGYFLNDGGRPNTAFAFEDCVARNHLMPRQTTKYKNGDGFVVEGNSSDVRFLRCRSLRNQDGGFDLKVPEVRLADCVAVGNSRGFRIWSTGTLDNCFAGWGTVGLWSNGGPVRARRCTFHELKDAAVLTDDAATAEVTVVDGLITASTVAQRNTARGTVALPGTVVAVHPDDADYPKPEKEWDGLGRAMDDRAHPDKGYRSALHSEIRRK